MGKGSPTSGDGSGGNVVCTNVRVANLRVRPSLPQKFSKKHLRSFLVPTINLTPFALW